MAHSIFGILSHAILGKSTVTTSEAHFVLRECSLQNLTGHIKTVVLNNIITMKSGFLDQSAATC